MELRILIAGSGGQGILFLGMLIAHAAMLEGKEVTWFPSYGAEIRGGTANCTVIISHYMIGSPVIRNVDALISMNRPSYDRFLRRVAPGGIVVLDSTFLHPADIKPPAMGNDIKCISVPATKLSASLHAPKSANMAMIGAFISATHTLKKESLFKALIEITPPHRKHLLEINREIIEKGYALIENKES
jgi:2-oxoglutarate ferredoxin oxidoreductase subunit gamma